MKKKISEALDKVGMYVFIGVAVVFALMMSLCLLALLSYYGVRFLIWVLL